MSKRNQAQIRAGDALDKIQALSNLSEGAGTYGNYIAYASSLPATIITSGLGQALAMQHAVKSKLPGHDYLNRHIEDWLRRGWQASPYFGKEDLLRAIVDGTDEEYVRAQVEVMAYLEWIKKFASAFLEKTQDASVSSSSTDQERSA